MNLKLSFFRNIGKFSNLTLDKHFDRFVICNFEPHYYGSVIEFVEICLNEIPLRFEKLICQGAFKVCTTKLILESGNESCKECFHRQTTGNLLSEISNSLSTAHVFLTGPDQSVDLSELQIDKVGNIAFFDFIMRYKRTQAPSECLGEKEYLEFKRDCLTIASYLWKKREYFSNLIFIFVNGNYSTYRTIGYMSSQIGARSLSIELHPLQNIGNRAIRILDDRWALGRNLLAPNKPIHYKPLYLGFFLVNLYRRRLGLAHNSFVSGSNSFRRSRILSIRNFAAKFREVYVIFLSSSEELQAHFVADGIDVNGQSRIQIELIESVLRRAKSCPDICYIIRAHPRQGASKMGAEPSEEWKIISDLLDICEIPNNVSIIPPEEEIDSYLLASLSSCNFVLWSTIGIELLFMGYRVVQLSKLVDFWPLQELSAQPSTEEAALESLFSSNSWGAANENALLGWASVEMGSDWMFTNIPIGPQSRKYILLNTIINLPLRRTIINDYRRIKTLFKNRLDVTPNDSNEASTVSYGFAFDIFNFFKKMICLSILKIYRIL